MQNGAYGCWPRCKGGVNPLAGAGSRCEAVWVPEDHFGDQVAEVYDDSSAAMFAPEVLGSTVDRLAELAGDGAALEFAIGTGRVALPLAARGVPGCIGSNLARLQIRVAVAQLVARLGPFRIPPGAQIRYLSLQARGPISIPLEFSSQGYQPEARAGCGRVRRSRAPRVVRVEHSTRRWSKS